MAQILAGKPYPLGATPDSDGTNFALFSANATRVELCLFDKTGKTEVQRISLPKFTDDVWHGYIPGIAEGDLYAYRVDGPFAPHDGHRFNPAKLLLDPYARQLKGKFISSDTHLAYDPQSSQQDLTRDYRDNSPYMPKCVVKNPLTSKLLASCERPKQESSDAIIYEAHVKGFSKLNPHIPVQFRGTFKGMSHPSVTDYLKKLGINCIELMPVQAYFDEAFLNEKGLKNYWGYNSIAFFAPESRLCATDDLNEFRQMVTSFHDAGIEVILDVVYNHTAEGNHLGPTYSFKGIDNASYYRLEKSDPRYYVNHSGCGNTLDLQHPRVLQMVMDSLRYWVEVMQVDGFRFDLASSLARGRKGKGDFLEYSSFFAAIKQDPTLSQIKLIAEPWDLGEGGYQLGRFPNSWMEWNDQFRDTIRRFWRGDQGMLPELAKRLHGSADIFWRKSRCPYSSVNFISAHDGNTLHDLVTFEQKYNQDNGENNQDGHKENFSCNYGVEGETDVEEINSLRDQQKRNLFATLMIAQGTPMLLAGDEFSNTQKGNNNAYCQDNETAWLDWSKLQDQKISDELDFVRHLIQIRKEHPLLNRISYHHGHKRSARTGLPDIGWHNEKGEPMSGSDWHNPKLKCFAMLLADIGDEIKLTKSHLEPNDHCSIEYGKDDAILIVCNAHVGSRHFQLPELPGKWKIIVDTAASYHFGDESSQEPYADKARHEHKLTQDNFFIAGQSCVVLTYLHPSTEDGKW